MGRVYPARARHFVAGHSDRDPDPLLRNFYVSRR